MKKQIAIISSLSVFLLTNITHAEAKQFIDSKGNQYNVYVKGDLSVEITDKQGKDIGYLISPEGLIWDKTRKKNVTQDFNILKDKKDRNALSLITEMRENGVVKVIENGTRNAKTATNDVARYSDVQSTSQKLNRGIQGVTDTTNKNSSRITANKDNIHVNTKNISLNTARIGKAEQAIIGLDNKLQSLDHRVDDVQAEARAGIANAMAMSALRFDTNPGKISVAGGFGGFHGANAFAAGLGYTSEGSIWRVNAGLARNLNSNELSWNAGASFTFN